MRLAGLADAWLTHDRPIHVPCDDSVTRAVGGARGAGPPVPRLRAAADQPAVRRPAVAGRRRRRQEHLLPRRGAAGLDVRPHRRHGRPGHPARVRRRRRAPVDADRRRAAGGRGRPPPGVPLAPLGRRPLRRRPTSSEVQHHHAHVASTMAEHGVPDGRRVIGVAFDGTGYGDDGAVVGRGVPGRRLPRRYERAAHLAYVDLPGGDAGVRNPCRMALSHLRSAGVPWDPGAAQRPRLRRHRARAARPPARDRPAAACRPPAWAGSSTRSRRSPASATAPSTTPRPRWSSRRSRGRSGSPSSSGVPGSTTSARTATRRRSSGRWCRTCASGTDPGLVAARFQRASSTSSSTPCDACTSGPA